MCGICGVLSSDMTPKKLLIFRHLLVVNTIRGAIGGGIAAFPAKPKQKVQVFRTPGASTAEMAYDTEINTFLNKTELTCLIGHSRLPTSGGLGIEDCHPIMGSHTIGVHNGTLTNVNGKPVGKTDHDSRLLFSALDNTRSPEHVLENTEGAMAAVWINKQTSRLWMYRNLGRPLHLATVNGDPSTIFWSSEAEALDFVIRRQLTDSSALRLLALEPFTMLSFTLRPQKNGAVLPMETIRLNLRKLEIVPPNVTSKVMYPTTRTHSVEEDELLQILQAGCDNCVQPASFDSYKKQDVLFYTDTKFMCATCLEYDEFARRVVEAEKVHIPDHIKFVGKPAVH